MMEKRALNCVNVNLIGSIQLIILICCCFGCCCCLASSLHKGQNQNADNTKTGQHQSLGPAASVRNQMQSLASFSLPALERCPSGAPAQWRPHLDAASKAHLAPIVALASLRQLQLLGSGSAHNELLFYQLQNNINNPGLTIEATFSITSILKRPQAPPFARAAPQPGQPKMPPEVRLYYHVVGPNSMASLHSLLQLANQTSSSPASKSNGASGRGQLGQLRAKTGYGSQARTVNRSLAKAIGDQLASGVLSCALELSDNELNKKLARLFKLDQNYILYLDQYQSPTAATSSSYIAHSHSQAKKAAHTNEHQPANSNSQHRPTVIRRTRANNHDRAAAPSPRHSMISNASQQSPMGAEPRQAAGQSLEINPPEAPSPLGSTAAKLLANLNEQALTPAAWFYPFATHEPLNNQSSKSVSKILCKNCGK